MGRIRSIKPEFFRHESLYQAEIESGLPLRVAFAGLWTVADREGRFRWRPRELKLDVLPYDNVDFSRVLDALTTRGFLVEYAIDGERYGVIPTFTKHQIVNPRERASVLPEPNETNTLTREARVEDASSTLPSHSPSSSFSKGESEGEAPRKQPSKRGTKLPADWKPSDLDRQFARDRGLDDDQIEFQINEFCEYWRSEGVTKKNWSLTFRNRIDNEIAWKHGVKNLPRKPAATAIAAIVSIKPGTPQWDAWYAHYVDQGKSVHIQKMNEFAEKDTPFPVPHGWPPGHQPTAMAA